MLCPSKSITINKKETKKKNEKETNIQYLRTTKYKHFTIAVTVLKKSIELLIQR